MNTQHTTTGAGNTTSAQHTLGPWEIDENEIFAEGDYFVARVNKNQYTPHTDKRKAVTSKNWSLSEQDKANARLIAAAPELLAAARMANQELLDLGVGSSASPALQALWSAIAKAEGQQ